MQWIEYMVRVPVAYGDAVAEVFSEHGYQGVAVEHDGIPPDKLDEDQVPPPTHYIIRAYVPNEGDTQAALERLRAATAHLPIDAPSSRNIDETDWSAAWKRHYKPVRLGKRIVIRPVWEQVDLRENDIEIALDPGMAFGTGTHATTQLCLEAVERHVHSGVRVLDLGCGSGVLSIAAAKLGASAVLAVDIDPVATEATAENVVYNQSPAVVHVITGGLPQALATGETYDVALVNILARIIVAMCGQGLERTVPVGGVMLLSGLIDTQADEVETALRSCGMEPTARYQQGDWMLLEATRTH